MAFHAISIASIDYILSRIPSQQSITKSYLEDSLNLRISGSAEMTPYTPPKQASLAYISPIVRDTDSFPGYILKGPIIG